MTDEPKTEQTEEEGKSALSKRKREIIERVQIPTWLFKKGERRLFQTREAVTAAVTDGWKDTPDKT